MFLKLIFSSIAKAIFNIFCSSKVLPIICKPNGYPFESCPAGIEIPGKPARLTGTVNISLRYIETGSFVFSPILNAELGVDGVNIASTFLYASSKSFFINFLIRKLIKNDFDEAYKKVDAILTPSTPSSAFKIGEKTNDPVSMYLNDIFTVPVNLAGLPGISIPAGHDSKGYPLGLQIIGKTFDEQNILNIAFAMEEKINFKNKIIDWWIK